MNFLESLIAEWLEYNGYFVRRNIKYGRRVKGGWEGELDVVGFHPEKPHLIHYECSTDAWTKAVRAEKFSKKLSNARAHIPSLFPGLALPPLEQKILGLFTLRKQISDARAQAQNRGHIRDGQGRVSYLGSIP